ncbi:TIGR00159 family protein, partial [bacterium]|nr:TIGR00159 family protein [bacterium]
MGELLGQITAMTFTDVIDILVIAALFYYIFTRLRETRSSVALRGMITLLMASFLIYLLARVFGLVAVSRIFENIWIVIVLVFMIVFQNEFKRALTEVGQLRAFRALFTQSGQYLVELVKAVRTMSNRHVGALIVIERRNSLRPYAETGTVIDSTVQAELIRTIFTPYSPLHDGAVIISGDRISAAACILPLTAAQDISPELGTRHRAAIGLSEETDAVVVVVSEETGTISLAVGGEIQRSLTPEELKKRLESVLEIKQKVEKEAVNESV